MTAETPKTAWLGLLVLIVLCFAVAGLGGLATTPSIPNWYARLVKPAWTPPDWLFGPGVVGSLSEHGSGGLAGVARGDFHCRRVAVASKGAEGIVGAVLLRL